MTHHVRIKICGIRDQVALDTAVESGADFVGFVRWAGSPRHVEADEAVRLGATLPETVEPVGLFVDASLQEILACPFKWIQLHGNEDEALAEALQAEGRHVIRGFRFDQAQLMRWDACTAVDRLLVDGSRIGGTGDGFDHEALAAMLPELDTPLFVAGGLTPDNVDEVIRCCMPWGVDVSSGVERLRGVKDPELIDAFCEAARPDEAAPND